MMLFKFAAKIVSLMTVLLMAYALTTPIYAMNEKTPTYVQLPKWGESGMLIDETVGLPVSGAIVNLSWRLEKSGGQARKLSGRKPRLYVQQVISNNQGRFTVGGGADKFRIPEGWQLADDDLVVSIFHPSYTVVTITDYEKFVDDFPPFSEEDAKKKQRGLLVKMVRIKPTAFSDKKVGKPLPAQWKNAIEEEVMNFSWRGREFALATQLPLMNSLRAFCQGVWNNNASGCPKQNAYLMRFLDRYPQVVQARDKRMNMKSRPLAAPGISAAELPALKGTKQ